MAPSAGATTQVVVVTNPHAGGGKPDRFDLPGRAESMGAQVWPTSAGHDAGILARRAVQQGAQVLGVAGGDGTVSAVAAVAADTDRPLLVIPAGTRNHFARDLGLDIRTPVPALNALHDGVSARVDLGMVGSHVFVNNVSFGIYAHALLEPGYRKDKARTFATAAPGYLRGEQWVEADVDTPQGPVTSPQVVLVSNNPYHLANPRYLGRRLSLTTGLLGSIVLKRPTTPPPDLLYYLRDQLHRQGAATPAVITWSATSITLHSTSRRLHAGIDGEPATLPTPITCTIRPGALHVLLPKNRPGTPPHPRPRPPGPQRTRTATPHRPETGQPPENALRREPGKPSGA